MNLRTLLNRHPVLSAGAMTVTILMSAWVLWSQVIQTPGASRIPDACYYTTDDGKTWFAESLLKVPPFEHEGKTAVKVVVVQCGSKPPTAAYLMRYTEKGKATIQAYRAEGQTKGITPAAAAYQKLIISGNEVEFKRPGDAQWLSGATSRAVVAAWPGCTETSP